MIRIALLALIACGLAGFGTIVWMVMPHGDAVAAKAATIERVRVLIAAKTLRPGALLKSEDLAVREVEQDKLLEGYINASDEDAVRRGLTGGMVRRSLGVGDMIGSADVVRPGDHGFLSAVLRPGYRAVTVAVDAVSGAAGLIWPGDRVDLILTQSMDDQAGLAPGRKFAAETVLRDVRVIAIDQQMMQGASNTLDGTPARTVTLEVSSANGEQVQVATRLGKLSLAVRSAELGATEDKERTTWAGDVSNALNNQTIKPAVNTLKVYSGNGDQKEFKF